MLIHQKLDLQAAGKPKELNTLPYWPLYFNFQTLSKPKIGWRELYADGILHVLFLATPMGVGSNNEVAMKEGIHPKYHKVLVTCACGNKFETHSTKPDIRLEMCSSCHPFFTGRQKLIDTAGRIERFQKRYGLSKGDKTAQN